ncbi:hypothetical protein ACLOJK_037988, partial [Asimina triloba]
MGASQQFSGELDSRRLQFSRQPCPFTVYRLPFTFPDSVESWEPIRGRSRKWAFTRAAPEDLN